MVISAVAGCARSPRPTTPEDPFRAIGVAPLPAGALAGGSVLVLPVGALVLTDSASRNADLVARQYALRAVAGALLDSALVQRAPSVTWVGLAEQQRALRLAPALGIEPARLETGYLANPKVESLVDPLWGQVRALAGMTNARMAVAPAAVRLDRRGSEYTAEYVLVLVDSREGTVLGRGRTQGPPAATPEAALAAAAAVAVPATGP
jgi:hypothetical protein